MIMKVNPDVHEAKHLRIWYDAGGRLTQTPTTVNRPMADGNSRNLGSIQNCT